MENEELYEGYSSQEELDWVNAQAAAYNGPRDIIYDDED